MRNFLKMFSVLTVLFCAGAAFAQFGNVEDAVPPMSLFTDKYIKAANEVKAGFVASFDPATNTVGEYLVKLDDALWNIRPNHEKLFNFYPKDAPRLQDSILYSFINDVSAKTKAYAKVHSKPFQTEVKNAVKKIMKTYQPKDVDDMMEVGMKMFADTMKAIGARHSDFLTRFPEYYNAAYSINQYTVTQDFLLSLLKGTERGAARYKKDLWLQYAKTLQRALDNIGLILWFGADDDGIKAANFLLDPMLGTRLDAVATKNIGFRTVASESQIRAAEKEVYQRYRATIKEFVAQYTGKKAKQGLRDDLSGSDSGEGDDGAAEQQEEQAPDGEPASINEAK